MNERVENSVSLVPVTSDHLDLFAASFDGVVGTGVHQWFGHTSDSLLRQQWVDRRLLNGEHNMLTVQVDEVPAGRVEWFSRSWGRPTTSACWEIAIGLLPAYQGRGVGTEAQRLLITYIFEHTQVERIQMTTDPENRAQVRAAAKVGFVLEGRIRRAQWRQGAWHDQLLYSLLRGDPDDRISTRLPR